MVLLLVFENDFECSQQVLGPKCLGKCLLPADL
jgi:hypothetical protein